MTRLGTTLGLLAAFVVCIAVALSSSGESKASTKRVDCLSYPDHPACGK